MWWMIAASLGWAAPAETPVTLSGGLTQFVGEGGGGAGATARVLGNAGRVGGAGAIGLEAGSREGYLWGADRLLSSVGFGVRYTPNHGPYACLGFLHHHETERALFQAHPVSAALGSLAGIHHRSGLEAGVGLDAPVLQRGYGGRLGLAIELDAAVFPDRGGSRWYVFLEQTLTIDVGRRRGADRS